MKNQTKPIIISLLFGAITFAEAVKVESDHLWNDSALKFMDNEQFQEDSPAGYADAVAWTKSPMTDKELDSYSINVNLEEATKLAKKSAHTLGVLAQKPKQARQGVRMLAEMQEWDADDLEYMGHEGYVKKTPKNYQTGNFEKVSMADLARKDYDKVKAEADAEKWAKRAQHHTYMASTLAQKQKGTYPSEDSHSYISPYNQRDHAWSFDQHDHQNEDSYETETSKKVAGWTAEADKTIEQLKAEAAAEAAKEAAKEAELAKAAAASLAQVHKKHKSHHKHHHQSKKNVGRQTYPQPDSHSRLEPWTQRDHAWTHDQHDVSNENKFEDQTEKLVPGWKAEADKTLEQLKAEAAAAKAKAAADATTAEDSQNKANSLVQQLARAQSLAQYFRVETESYISPWTQRDHAWSDLQADNESEADWVAETKALAPGIDFAQRASMHPESLAEAAEALGMRVQLADADAVDKEGNPTTAEGEEAKGTRSRLSQYRQADHAWTDAQYDMSNEKSWRKATWDLTGYKSDRFFQAGSSSSSPAAGQGDKMVDTLVMANAQDIPQAMAQKYRVETKSQIQPYVVRDHAWSTGQHDDSNAAEYQKDAPAGYADRMDFEAEPYNKPLGQDAADPVEPKAKSTQRAQESAPGDKKVTIVQHPEHKEAAKELKKEIKAEKKIKKEEAKKEAKKEQKATAKQEEKKVTPKTEAVKAPKLAEKKEKASEQRKIQADKFDNHEKSTVDSKEAVKEDKKATKEVKTEKKAEKTEATLVSKSIKNSEEKSKPEAKSSPKAEAKTATAAATKAESKTIEAVKETPKTPSADAKKPEASKAHPESEIKKEGERVDTMLAKKEQKKEAKKEETAKAKVEAKVEKKEAPKASAPAAATATVKKVESTSQVQKPTTTATSKDLTPASAVKTQPVKVEAKPAAQTVKPAPQAPLPKALDAKAAPAAAQAKAAAKAPAAPVAPVAVTKK